MLEAPASMTVLKLQRLPSLPHNKMDSEQESPSKTSTPSRQSESPRISFSVAALLADTRPRRSPTPVLASSEDGGVEDDDQDLDDASGAEDDVDVEVTEGPRTPPTSVSSFLQQQQAAQVARLMLPVAPVRPTPFSALAAAAAAYSAGLQQPHPQSWVHGHYPGSPVFPSFGGGLSGSPGKTHHESLVE